MAPPHRKRDPNLDEPFDNTITYYHPHLCSTPNVSKYVCMCVEAMWLSLCHCLIGQGVSFDSAYIMQSN